MRWQSIFQIDLIIVSTQLIGIISFLKAVIPCQSWESGTGCKFLGNMRDGFRWIALYSMFALHSSIFNIRSLALVRPSFGLISRSKMEDRALHCAHKSFGKQRKYFDLGIAVLHRMCLIHFLDGNRKNNTNICFIDNGAS